LGGGEKGKGKDHREGCRAFHDFQPEIIARDIDLGEKGRLENGKINENLLKCTNLGSESGRLRKKEANGCVAKRSSGKNEGESLDLAGEGRVFYLVWNWKKPKEVGGPRGNPLCEF